MPYLHTQMHIKKSKQVFFKKLKKETNVSVYGSLKAMVFILATNTSMFQNCHIYKIGKQVTLPPELARK